MSASSASRGLRNGSRGRWSARPAIKGKDMRNGNDRPRSRRTTTKATTSTDSGHLNPRPSRNHVRNKSWRKPDLEAAIQSHAGKARNPKTESWRNPTVEDSRTYKLRMNDLYQTLKHNREGERKDAIRDGFLANPDKPTSLANAITPVGTCQDMCPEFERVERIVQLMVDGSEKVTSSSDPDAKVPCEDLMVKRFRRSAAGYDEQLPSDIRPPLVLQKTLDYLFNTAIGGSQSLANVHKFVWDRTRGIRNDFSIQQVTKIEDLRIAIDCFERIARFHILSLHQLSKPDGDNGEFDHHQEREQLNNTLLSLMYYYDDSRKKLASPNEAEFRAYCIIFEIQDQRPDLEDRAQNFPRNILKDQRVQTALKLYAAAGNISDDQGPLRPRTPFSVAQANTGGFWKMINSNAVSYLTACVAEVYFNLVRRTALEAIWKAYKGKRGGPTKMEDWTMKDLTPALGFDNEDQTWTFCEDHAFGIEERDDGEAFVDLGSVVSGNLIDRNPHRKQIFSRSLVEHKRLGRTIPAVINGQSASQAQSQGLVEDSSDAENSSAGNDEPLFVDESDEEQRSVRSRSNSPPKPDNNIDIARSQPGAQAVIPKPAIFGNDAAPPKSSFGLPSSVSCSQPEPEPEQAKSMSNDGIDPRHATSSMSEGKTPKFNFFSSIQTVQADEKSNISKPNQPSGLGLLNPSSTNAKPESTENNPKIPPFGAPFGANKSIFGQSSITPTTSKALEHNTAFSISPLSTPPKFSFTTSPIFQANAGENADNVSRGNVSTITEPPRKQNLTSPSNDINRNSPQSTADQQNIQSQSAKPALELSNPFSSPSFPPSEPTSSTLFTSHPPNQPTETEQSTLPPSSVATPAFHERKDVPFPPQPTTEQSLIPLSSAPVPKFSAFSQPRISATQPNVPSQLSLSGTALVPSEPSGSQDEQLTRISTQPESQQAALEKLSSALMLEDHGLLQQFIEFTVGPIVKSTIAHVEDEDSWQEARECRRILLSKKYLLRWKVAAWNLSLIRRGKERRRNLAKSVQDLARSKGHNEGRSSVSLRSDTATFDLSPNGRNNSVNSMPPPSQPPRKRQSLPPRFDQDSPQSPSTTASNKRKRDDLATSVDHGNLQRSKIHHQRANTIADSTMSTFPRYSSHVNYKPRVDVSKITDGSLFGETIRRNARRLAPNAKTDTTRTDYFQLKALGIDPDTPIVPLTKKRGQEDMPIDKATKHPRISQLSVSSPSILISPSPQPATQNPSASLNLSGSVNDEDEALFAQIRSVREAMAESTTWFKSERESIERSMTPLPSASPPNDETPAQRRLREMRERGHTPSRSEVRLRAMGDKALLPKGFWDGEGMGRSLTEKENGKGLASPTRLQGRQRPVFKGFAAIGAQGSVNGAVSARYDEENEKKNGASVDDAIEL